MIGPNWYRYDNELAAAAALADCVASGLEGALNLRDRATLAVSGGSTPRQLFEILSQIDLDWSRVVVTLVDERWVAADHPDANAGLVRQHLLRDHAAAARFVPMKTEHADAFMAESGCAAQLQDFAECIDVAVLGMGLDGHTASFFPEAETLRRALDVHSSELCVAVRPPAAPHDRMTLTLAALQRCRHLYLQVNGAEKCALLEQAIVTPDVERWPVCSVLQRAANPLQVFSAIEEPS